MGNCYRSTDFHAVSELVSPFEWLSNSSKEKHEQHFCHAQLSSPLGVFAGAQGILQPHSNRSCHTRSSFNVFLSLSLPQGIMLSPKSQGAVVLSCLPCTFAGGWEAVRWNIFRIPSCSVFPELRRPHGIAIIAAGRGQSRRILGLGLVQHREGLEQLWGKMKISNITVAPSSPNWGQCYIRRFYSSDVPRAPVHPHQTHALVIAWGTVFKSSSIWALFSSSPSLHTPWTWRWWILQHFVWERWGLG